jgi:hypothetical protein
MGEDVGGVVRVTADQVGGIRRENDALTIAGDGRRAAIFVGL